MKKKLIFLCEYPFTLHNSFKMEIEYLKKKKIDFTVIDLSQVIYGKNLSREWKSEIERNSIKFSSLISWLRFFSKLDKKKLSSGITLKHLILIAKNKVDNLNFEICISDNNSDQSTEEVIRKYDQQLKIRFNKNEKFQTSYNYYFEK